jgi:hypothetical protein
MAVTGYNPNGPQVERLYLHSEQYEPDYVSLRENLLGENLSKDKLSDKAGEYGEY